MKNEEQLFEIIKTCDNPAKIMETLLDKVAGFIEENPLEKENALRLFIVEFLYLMDASFTKIGFKLHDWIDKSLPEVPESNELKEKREKLKRKRNKIYTPAYRKRFRRAIYRESDTTERTGREFDKEAFDSLFDEIENKIRAIEIAEKQDLVNRRAEIMKAELENLFSAIFGGFEVSDKIQNPVASYILQIVNTEHFLLFVKRICSILEMDIKKNNGWTERSVILGRFAISLKQKIKDIASAQTQAQDPAVLKRVLILRDIAAEVELFITEINNSIVAQRKQEQFQTEIQDVLKSGFRQVIVKLGSIESGMAIMNKQMSGIDGRLSDILKVNGEILKSSIQNGEITSSLSNKLDGISEKLSDIGDMIFDLTLDGKK